MCLIVRVPHGPGCSLGQGTLVAERNRALQKGPVLPPQPERRVGKGAAGTASAPGIEHLPVDKDWPWLGQDFGLQIRIRSRCSEGRRPRVRQCPVRAYTHSHV